MKKAAMMISLPSLPLTIKSALHDGLNPMVLALFVAILLVVATRRRSGVLLAGSMFSLGILLVYLLAGLEVVKELLVLPRLAIEYVSLAIGTVIVVAGLRQLANHFWPASPPDGRIAGIRLSLMAIVPLLLGVFIAGARLPYTGASYLAIIAMAAVNFNQPVFELLVASSLAIIFPELVLLVVIASSRIGFIRERGRLNHHYVQLGAGILLVALGWLFMLMSNGTINF